MKKITERDVIRNLLKSFDQIYGNELDKPSWGILGETRRNMRAELAKLDLETATAEEVTKAWGHQGWNSMPSCSECSKHKPDVVYEIGEPLDYESRTAFLCEDCMKRLVWEFIDQSRSTTPTGRVMWTDCSGSEFRVVEEKE